MLKAAVGHSNDPDSALAITEVLSQCQAALDHQPAQAGVLFAAIDFDHELILQEIDRTYPNLQLIGGTTDGEISSVLGFDQDSLTLILFQTSSDIQIRAGIGTDVAKNPDRAAQMAIAMATPDPEQEITFCLTFPESLTASAVVILKRLQDRLGSHIPIFGGLTADRWQFQQTYQFCGQNVYSDAVPVLLWSGPVLFSHGVASGWNPIGKPGRVTHVESNTIYTIDDQPALDFYQRYLGPLPPSSEYPLAVLEPDSNATYMRAPSGIFDEKIGSISFFGDIPDQSIIQITEATRDSILLASETSMQQALANYPGPAPSAALFFSCASRRQILGTRTPEEYRRVEQTLSQPLPCCGFYTNGEIAPLAEERSSHFHNETFITLLLGAN